MASLPSLTLIGPGRAGRAFARSWLASGGALEAVLGRSRDSALAAAREIGSGRPGVLGADRFGSEVALIAVPDDRLSEAAREAASSGSCGLAYHLSGALPAGILAPLSEAGASVGSFHPLRAFTGASEETLRGAFVAIEGEEAACRSAMGFADALGARGHRIAPGSKPLYHAGATLAAGGVVSVVGLAARAWSLAGIPEQVARPALSGLASRAAAGAETQPFAQALTGPIARRDLSTVRAHCAALAGHPELIALYRALAEETIARTPGLGREEELRAILAC
ncbi:MAG: Rossmann-like and DUF2520 domain-containing protein [Thermoanaerobaculia bacterium]|nr:DUF2520 domain-containing protein [Acidobacteriota bacterium]